MYVVLSFLWHVGGNTGGWGNEVSRQQTNISELLGLFHHVLPRKNDSCGVTPQKYDRRYQAELQSCNAMERAISPEAKMPLIL